MTIHSNIVRHIYIAYIVLAAISVYGSL